MNVTLLHYSAPPVVGGVESVLAHHARLLVEAGHRVKIIAGRGGRWDDRLTYFYLPAIDSRHPDVLALKALLDQGNAPPQFERLAADIASALRPALAEIDVLILHNVCSLNKNLALTATLHKLNAESARPRFILWHHDLAWTTPRYRAELHAGYPWNLLCTNWPGVRHVVVSESRRRELAELLRLEAHQIAVIPNGVDLADFYKFEPQTRVLFDTLQLAEAEPILLLPVRITPRKNIELGVRTLAALRRELPQAALVVTGPEGPHNPANAEYKKNLFALRDELGLRGAVHFLAEQTMEFLPDAVIADFFRLADALLLPSREEGFGIPLLEAAASRLPIFCADIPPLRDLGAAEATYFSPEADPAVVAALIAQRLRSDPVYRFAARARRDFSWATIYARQIEPFLLAEQ